MSEDKVAIGKLETRVDNVEKKVEKLEEGNTLLQKLDVILETQIELNKKQDTRLANMEKIFEKINVNLTGLNVNQEKLKDSIENIDNRVDKIEEKIEDVESKDSVSISEHLKKWSTFLLFGIPSSIIIGYVMIKFGFK